MVTPVTARWTGGTSANWGAGANWSTGVAPVDVMTSGSVTTCASVLFDSGATSQTTINLGGNQTVTSIAFSGATAFTLTGSNTLTIGEAGLTNSGAGAPTIACPVALRTSQRWTIGAGGLNMTSSLDLGSGTTNNLLLVEGTGTAVLNGPVGGTTGGLAVDGGATLVLSNSSGNTFGGKTFINSGTVVISQDNHLGTPPAAPVSNQLSINGGTLEAAATLGLNANRGIALGIQNGTLQTDAGVTVTENAPISGFGGLTKSGAGTLILSSSSDTYAGMTTVSGGTLDLSNSLALQNSTLVAPTAGSVVFDQAVASRTFTLGGLSGSGNLSLINNATTPASVDLIVGGNGGGATYFGQLSGLGSLYKVGSGVLTFAGLNTYTGVTSVNTGTLVVTGTGCAAQLWRLVQGLGA